MEKEFDPEYPHPDFLKGFNEGYALAKYAPEIGGVFGPYVGESERGKGFAKGKDQYVYEVSKERYPELLKEGSENRDDVTKDVRKDRDSMLRDYEANRQEMDINREEGRMPNLLRDIDQNKDDMDLDREPEKDKDDLEPERD